MELNSVGLRNWVWHPCSKAMANLVVLEFKDTDKTAFLDSTVSAQKLSQAMHHFLPKRFSSAAASSLQVSSSTQKPAMSASMNSPLRNSVSISLTPHHPKPGLGSHSRCVKVGLGNNQTRPLTQIHSQTLFQGHVSNFGPGQQSLHSPIQSRESAGKEWHGNGSGSSQRVRVLQLLLPSSKEWWPQAHPCSKQG